MTQLEVSERLFVVLASGGTLERCLMKLPGFRQQIEAAFGWMSSNAQSRSCEIRQLAEQYGEAIRTKDAALRGNDIPTAAAMRSEEHGIFDRLGFKAPPSGWSHNAIMEVGVDQQIEELSALLGEKPSGGETGAPPL